MIKILKQGTKPIEVVCDACNSLLSYNKSDVKNGCINCPVCDQIILCVEEKKTEVIVDHCGGNTDCSKCDKELCVYR